MQGNDSEPETGKQMAESKEMGERRGAYIELEPRKDGFRCKCQK